jgi:hypothetical protein
LLISTHIAQEIVKRRGKLIKPPLLISTHIAQELVKKNRDNNYITNN